MNTVLTIDIGLRNLAMCAMECPKKKNDITHCNIVYWNVINILEECDSNQLCQSLNKNTTFCGKKCSFKYQQQESNNVIYTCKRHFPKELGPPKHKNKVIIKQVKEYQLQDIAERVLTAITQVYSQDFHFKGNLTKILIELQPKVNNKMKLVSHIIFTKFIDLILTDNLKIPVRFVRATKKLKLFKEKGPKIQCHLKGEYAKRKFFSIKYTEHLLQENKNFQQHWIDFFNKHTKKDDLSDTFLFCVTELL
jgi:hypothetical protein